MFLREAGIFVGKRKEFVIIGMLGKEANEEK